MRNSNVKIFAQLVALVLAVFAIMILVLNYSLEGHFRKNITEQLEATAQGTLESLEFARSQAYTHEQAQRHYGIIVDFYSRNTKSYIMVFDRNGSINACSDNTYKFIRNRLPQKLVEKVISGEAVYATSAPGEFFDFEAIIAGKPIVTQGVIEGGIFCASAAPRLSQLKDEMFRLIWWAMIAALMCALCIGFVITRQISKPIREIDKAVKAVSKGDYSKKINLHGSPEMRVLSENFNKMTLSLENLDMTSKNFIANVSHELRTPMTIITGFMQGIADGTVPEEKRSEYTELVINETKRLTRLVNDLLDVARIESGSSKMVFEKFDINERLRLALIKFENRIEEKNINVQLMLANDVTYVYAAPDSIERVITNLIDNAVKFTEAGGDICLKTAIKGDTVYISVINSGEGIDLQEIEQIWQRFHKSDKSRSRDKTGAGLGLYIVKSIINMHNQNITVTSEKGGLTEFKFTLKLAK